MNAPPTPARPASQPAPGGLRRALDHIDRWSARLIMATMAVMVVVVSVQVFLRYALSQSMDAADELGRLCFVWSVFMAVPHAIRQARHVGIDVLVKHLPRRLFARLYYGGCIAAGVLMLIVAWQAAVVAADSWDQLMPTLDLSSGWFYVSLVVCGLHSAAHLLLIVREREPAHLPATQEEPA